MRTPLIGLALLCSCSVADIFEGSDSTDSNGQLMAPGSLLLQILSPSQQVPAGGCSDAVDVEADDRSGRPGTWPTDIVLMLGGATFFSDAHCLHETSTVTIPKGKSSAAFFFSWKRAGPLPIQVSARGIAPVKQTEAILPGGATQLVYRVQPSNVVAGAPIAPAVVVEVEDVFGNVETGSSAKVSIDDAGVNANQGVATFSDLVRTQAGTGQMLTAQSDGLPNAVSQPFDVDAGTAVAFAFLGVEPTVAEVCSAPFTVTSQDTYGNLSPVSQDVQVFLSSNIGATGGFVSFYSDSACTTRIKLTTLAAGASSTAPLYYTRPVASPAQEGVTLQATGALTSASQLTSLTRNAAFTHSLAIPNADTGVINVKTYCAFVDGGICAAGDGGVDDTEAIQRAISLTIGTTSYRSSSPARARDSVIYFPSGVYKVTKPILWKDASGQWTAYVQFYGENKTDTVLRYADGQGGSNNGCVESGHSGVPSAVLFTASMNDGNNNGEGESGFRNHIRNLTIDVGVGNPALSGIDWVANNNARITDVNIVSGDGQGCVGLNGARDHLGPALIKNLYVQGFDYGGVVSGTDAAGVATFEHVRLQDQHIAGFDFPTRHWAQLRDLHSDNVVPATVQHVELNGDAFGVVLVLDSTLNGGDGGAAMVLENTGGHLPYLFERNTTQTGYDALISQDGGLKYPTGSEWVSVAPLTNGVTQNTTSMNLPIKETPELADDTHDGTDFSAWLVLVPPCGPLGSCDSWQELQHQIDTAGPLVSTVVIPWGYYKMSQPLMVGLNHGPNIKRLMGLGTHLLPVAKDQGSALVIGDTSHARLWVEGISAIYDVTAHVNFGASGNSYPDSRFVPVVSNQATTTVVILQDLDDITYKNQPDGGMPTSDGGTTVSSDVYMEGVAFGPFVFANQHAWVRNLDPEDAPADAQFLSCYGLPANFLNQGDSHVFVDGPKAQLVSLGFKTENREIEEQYSCDAGMKNQLAANHILVVENGAKAEALGLIMSQQRINNGAAAVLIDHASASVEGFQTHTKLCDYDISVQQNLSVGGTFIINRFWDSQQHTEGPYYAYASGTGSAIPLYVGY